MGFLISFSGIDGAGKTKQIKLLSKYLKNKRKKVLVTETLFGYFLFKPFIHLLRIVTKSPNEGPVRRNKNLLPKIWFIPAFIDIWISYLVKVRPALRRYDFILADRFYIDIWANLAYYGYLSDWAFVFFLKLLPKADKSFIFFVKPEIGRKRSPDFPLAYFKEQSKIYRRLTNYIVFDEINANHDPKKIFQKVKLQLKLGN